MKLVSAFESIDYESIKPLRRYKKLLKKINSRQDYYRDLTLNELKDEALSWDNVFDINNKKHVVELYALVREVTYRLLGKFQYDVQILGALASLERNIVQMSTGSGKTITLILPVIAHGFSHQGCNVLTVNEYLSERDYKETRVVYEFCGLTCAYVNNDMSPTQQQTGYACDITYSTNSSLGFAFLNSCLASGIGRDIKIIDRPLNVAIIDEVDEILMDDAINPLIIASEVPLDNMLVEIEHDGVVYKTQDIVNKLKNLRNMELDENNDLVMSDRSWNEIQKLFGFDDSIFENFELLHVIYNSVTAIFKHRVYEDYIVANEPDPDSGSRVILIDKATGRLSHGRTLSDNLHSFVEMKEGVFSGKATDNSIQITYQVLFNMFKLITGVTGTVGKCFKEFYDIYNTSVVKIPDRLPSQLLEQTRLFVTSDHLYESLMKEILLYQVARFPILIGCDSDKNASVISSLLTRNNIGHKTLLSTDKNEDYIIDKAGTVGSIVVTTDIMGRGTDIKISETDYERGLVVFQVGNRPNSRVERQFAGRAARQGEPGMYFRYLTLPKLDDIGFVDHDYNKLRNYYKEYEDLIDENYNGDLLMHGYAPYYDDVVSIIDNKLYGDESSYSQSRVQNYKTTSVIDKIQMNWIEKMDHMRSILKQSYEGVLSEDDFIDELIHISLEYDGFNYDELYNILKKQDLYTLQESLYNHIAYVVIKLLKNLRETGEAYQKTTRLTGLSKLEVKPEEYMKRLVHEYYDLNNYKTDYSINYNFVK